MTKEQLHILQHTLGVDEFGRGEQYRNHFCSGESDLAVCESLVILGHMERYPSPSFIPYPLFGATPAGREAMRDASPTPPKLSRSQKRYRAFLNSDSGMKFREWMRRQKKSHA